jgi:hypothetical protein
MTTKVMTIIFIIIAVAIVLLIVKSRIVPDVKVKTADIPLIYEKLKSTGKDANFAVFAFTPPEASSVDDAINIQFSIDKGKIGVDWVLIGGHNIQDKGKFAQFAGQLGYTVTALEMNHVKYLRVEDGDLPKLCEAVISNLYSMPRDTDLHLIPQGFTWP